MVSRSCFTLLPVWLLLAAALIWPAAGRWIIAAVLVLVIAGGIAGRLLLRRLSRRYPQLDVAGLPEEDYLIGVAGSGYEPCLDRAPESRFIDSFAIRLIEAGRIAAELDGRGVSYRICVSIPEHPELHQDKILALRAFFARFHLQSEQIEVLEGAADSFSEVAAFKRPGAVTILISHGWHLPRLMAIAESLGIRALPAPAGLVPDSFKPGSRRRMLPTAGSLRDLECALHELGGLCEITFRRRFRR
ncbi:MAG: hypothetical protein AB7F32_09275 [Victivallaceae bacterium]